MTQGISDIERNLAIVRRFYEGGTGDGPGLLETLLDDVFEEFAPGYLPWGERFGERRFVDRVLPQVTAALDFEGLSYVSLTAEGGSPVVALIDIGVKGGGRSVLIPERVAAPALAVAQ